MDWDTEEKSICLASISQRRREYCAGATTETRASGRGTPPTGMPDFGLSIARRASRGAAKQNKKEE
jgi:hypothetical protein